MVSTRREAAGARGEEERDGSEDESDEDDAAPWTDKERRLCAIELYAVAIGHDVGAGVGEDNPARRARGRSVTASVARENPRFSR